MMQEFGDKIAWCLSEQPFLQGFFIQLAFTCMVG